MSDLLPNEQLAIDLAAINVVTSAELVNNAASAADLMRYQSELDRSHDRVESVKNTLTELKTYELTPSLVQTLDNNLAKSGVDIPAAEGKEDVEGAEAFGLTLLPKEYILTRMQGIENFLGRFFEDTRELSLELGRHFKEGYTLFTQSQESLEKIVMLLENDLNQTVPFDGKPRQVTLGERLFNLFKVNEKVDPDWVSHLSKLSRTLSALSGNYYQNNQNVLNTTLSYFGGFSGLSQPEAEERFKLLPVAVPNTRFKECTYPYTDNPNPLLQSKRSVELMGGAFFVDTRRVKPLAEAKSVDEVNDFITLYDKENKISFENRAPRVYPKLGLEVKSLSTGEIKSVIRALNDVLKEWEKVYQGGDRYKLLDKDAMEISKGIYEADFSNELKHEIHKAFNVVVRKNQLELLDIRTKINRYLTLVVSGVVEFCYTSIKANTD